LTLAPDAHLLQSNTTETFNVSLMYLAAVGQVTVDAVASNAPSLPQG
jgi:hypothetical protein